MWVVFAGISSIYRAEKLVILEERSVIVIGRDSGPTTWHPTWKSADWRAADYGLAGGYGAGNGTGARHPP